MRRSHKPVRDLGALISTVSPALDVSKEIIFVSSHLLPLTFPLPPPGSSASREEQSAVRHIQGERRTELVIEFDADY